MESPPKQPKKALRFVVDLTSESSKPFKVETYEKVNDLSRKLNRYRRRYARIEKTVNESEQQNRKIAVETDELVTRHKKLLSRETEFHEEIARKNLVIKKLREELMKKNPQKFYSVSIEIMQEQLFSENETIDQLKLAESRAKNKKKNLVKTLNETRLEIEGHKNLINNRFTV